MSRQALSGLLNCRAALSAEMAVRFERAFGVRAETMLGMEVAHDLREGAGAVSKVLVVAA